MKITIDTAQDSHSDIKKVIAMLQHLVGAEASTNFEDSQDSSYLLDSNNSSDSSYGSLGYGQSESGYGSSDNSYSSEPKQEESRDLFSSSSAAPSMFGMFDSVPSTPEPVQESAEESHQPTESYSSHLSSEDNAAETASVLSMFDPPTPKPSASSLLRETNYSENSTDNDDDTFEYHIETY